MNKPGCFVLLLVVLVFGDVTNLRAQFTGSGKETGYKRIFVETDEFDAGYLQNLKQAIPGAANKTDHFAMLNDLAYYWHTRNLDTAMAYTRQGLTETFVVQDTVWHGRFLITQGATLLRQEKLDSAYGVLQVAAARVEEGDLPFLYTQTGYVFERQGQLDQAADYAMKSLRLGEKLGDKKAIAMAYSDLSNLFWKQAKFDKGLEYGLQSIEIFAERGINDLDYDFTLYLVGNNYLSLKKYDQSLAYFKQAIAMGEHYGFYNNLSDIYISLTDLYTHLRQYKEAETAGKNAVKYATLLGNNNFMLMRSWLSIGKLHNQQGQFREAIEDLHRCLAIATNDFGDEYFLSQAYEALALAYAGNKEFARAYQAQVKFDKLKDAIFTAAADQRISQLQTEFEVTQKDNTIRLQEAQLKQEKSRQLFITIIAVVLLLFLGVLYQSLRANSRKNKLLEKQNLEKEFLLKEIHHRVKNNLEVVSGLLTLQAEQIDDPNVKDAMQESQNRVNSMSMIHQRLYQGKNLATIDMKDYLMNLGNHVLDSYGATDSITLNCDLEAIEFDVDTAVPLGLMVNELLTNALKYAFPDNRQGAIAISLHAQQHHYTLVVADDGEGQRDGIIQGTGFGTQLINLLVQQLDGELNIATDHGTRVSFSFRIAQAA